MKTFLFLLILTCTLGTFVGCGGSGDGPAQFPVSGKVTFDGQPLVEGNIIFRDVAGKVTSAAGKIENGEYSLKSSAGLKQVVITATHEVPGKTAVGGAPDEVPTPAIEQYLPEQYNEKTSLEANVIDSGANEFSFELKSK